MTSYKEIEKMVDGRELPLMGENEDGEAIIVEGGRRDGEQFFKVTTSQKNNWCRVNIYYEDGTAEELYEK